MSSELPPERIAELREAFSLFDKDGSGSISMSEMKMVLLSLGVEPTDDDLREIIEEFDADNNNEIEFDEFVNIMANKFSKTDNEKMYMTVYAEIDTDKDGFITASELYSNMKSQGIDITYEEAEAMIAEVSPNGNGKLCYEEFVLGLSYQT